MARRLSYQQRRRIDAHQARRMREAGFDEDDSAQPGADKPGLDRSGSEAQTQIQQGRIVLSHGRTLLLEDAQGRVIPCVPRQNLGALVCGDRVLWQDAGTGQGVVTGLLPRTSIFARNNQQGRERPLAANIDLLVCILAPEPSPQPYLLDQYLISAELLRLEVVICLNKLDLLDEAAMAAFDADFGLYPQLGYPVVKLSARNGQGLEALLAVLHGRTSILLGQSGVGKSSLAQSLLGDASIKAGSLSAQAGKGRHTTTATRLYHLPQGGALIDSPGVRSFRPGASSMADLEQGFREFRPLLGQCRFRDCRHQDEPGCALIEALNQGQIQPQRLAHFRHMAALL